jgi:hypothetical protein
MISIPFTFSLIYFIVENLVLWASGSSILRLGEPGQRQLAMPGKGPTRILSFNTGIVPPPEGNVKNSAR